MNTHREKDFGNKNKAEKEDTNISEEKILYDVSHAGTECVVIYRLC